LGLPGPLHDLKKGLNWPQDFALDFKKILQGGNNE
jgi:hypothetical protein